MTTKTTNPPTRVFGRINLWILLLLMGALVLPQIPFVGLGIRLSDIVVLGVIPLVLLLYQRIQSNKYVVWLLLIWCLMIASTLFGYLFLSVPPSVRDFNELVRMFIPVLTLGATISIPKSSLEKTVVIFFRLGTPVLLVFGFLQFIVPNSIPTSLLHLYGGESHVTNLVTRSFPRVFVTGSDPNIGAAILLLFFFYHASMTIANKKLRSMIASGLFLVLIAFTASRTVFVALGLSIFLFLTGSRSVSKLAKASVLFAAVLFGVTVWQRVDYIRIGFQLLASGQNDSWLIRLENFRDAIVLFRKSPLLGWGPAKAIHETVVDGEYFLLLRRYGFIGLGSFLLFMLAVLRGTFRAMRRGVLSSGDHEGPLVATLFFFSGSMLVVMITNNFLSGYQLVVPYMILLGYFIQATRYPVPTGAKP